MLKEIIKSEQQKVQSWNDKLVTRHNEQLEKMTILKDKLEVLGEGCLKLSLKFAEPTKQHLENGYLPRLTVVNFCGCVDIANCDFNENGDIELLYVSGIGLFSLVGEKHSVESFFKKIARYLK